MRFLFALAAFFAAATPAFAEDPLPIDRNNHDLVACRSIKAAEAVLDGFRKNSIETVRKTLFWNPKRDNECALQYAVGPIVAHKVLKRYPLIAFESTAIEVWLVEVRYRGGLKLYFLFDRIIGRSA